MTARATAGTVRHEVRPGGDLRRAVATCVLAAALTGCRAEPAETTIASEQFIDAIVALRQADADTDDPAIYGARKAAILRAAGITDSMLIAFTRVHSRDLPLMAEVWDSIARRLVREDTIPR